jgi:predicted phosphoribosyltransferase
MVPKAPRRFRDRREAGRLLAPALRAYAGRADVVVLALPRGGVPVAFEVAMALGAPLDVFTVRKLGVPRHEELAMGAIASGGIHVLNQDVIGSMHISREDVLAIADRETRELARREQLYRDGRPFPELEGKVVILIDDGLATGASMQVAIRALRRKAPATIVVAVPIAPAETIADLRDDVDDVICYESPEWFGGVGAWYVDFSQVTDREVRALLGEAALRRFA